jgi:O-antigen ligase
MYVRLLTETGLAGFALFLAFYLAIFAEALSLLRGSKAACWLGAAGIFALVAVMLQGISQDSFAMPEMWINLGILTGAAGALQMQISQRKTEL